MLAIVVTTTIVGCTTIDNFHFNGVALLAVSAELVAWGAGAGVGTLGVDTRLLATPVVHLALINVFTSLAIKCEFEAGVALTDSLATVVDTFLFTPAIVLLTWVRFFTTLAVIFESEAGATATVVLAVEP